MGDDFDDWIDHKAVEEYLDGCRRKLAEIRRIKAELAQQRG